MRDRTLVITTQGNDLEYLNIVLNIIEVESKNFDSIRIVDLSPLIKEKDTFYRPLLRLKSLKSPDYLVFDYLEKQGIVVDYAFRVPGSASTKVTEQIEESTKSSLISRFGNETPAVNTKFNKRKSLYIEEGLSCFYFLDDYLSRFPDVTRVAVINGRFPPQRAVFAAAETHSIKCFSYERGLYEISLSPVTSSAERYVASDSFWYHDFPNYDRVSKQLAINKMSFEIAPIDQSRVSEWFESRMNPGGSNRYAEFWEDSKFSVSGKKVVAIFTSSMDEFAELGPTWREDNWQGQWDAFDYAIENLLSSGYQVFLRVHPNLANKKKDAQTETLKAIQALSVKYQDLQVINSMSNINSYSLIEFSDLVITWVSTLGLEASAMGKKAVCMAATEYDLVADVKRWLNKIDVKLDELNSWEVDRSLAYKFIAGLFKLDHDIEHLLPRAGIEVNDYNSPVALLANKWALRGNLSLKNLISIFLPRRIFVPVRIIYRKVFVR